jgi:hypothetical protein
MAVVELREAKSPSFDAVPLQYSRVNYGVLYECEYSILPVKFIVNRKEMFLSSDVYLITYSD